MPKYDYKCRDCEAVQEVTHRITEDPVIECLTCGSHNTRRLVGATRTIFKGAGFYKNEAALNAVGMPEHVKKHARERLFKD